MIVWNPFAMINLLSFCCECDGFIAMKLKSDSYYKPLIPIGTMSTMAAQTLQSTCTKKQQRQQQQQHRMPNRNGQNGIGEHKCGMKICYRFSLKSLFFSSWLSEIVAIDTPSIQVAVQQIVKSPEFVSIFVHMHRWRKKKRLLEKHEKQAADGSKSERDSVRKKRVVWQNEWQIKPKLLSSFCCPYVLIHSEYVCVSD